MKSSLLCGLAGLFLMSCSYGEYASLVRSQPPQGKPNFRPLDYPFCIYPNGPRVLLRWRLAIYSYAPVWPDDFDRDHKKGDPRNGCHPERQVIPNITWTNPGKILATRGVDSVGVGYFYGTNYGSSIFSENDLAKEREDYTLSEYEISVLKNTGSFSIKKEGRRTRISIGGREWSHYVVRKGDILEPHEDAPFEETSVEERYEIRLDQSHVFRIFGSIDTTMSSDPIWLAARRSLVRKMVEGTRVVDLTDAEFEKYKAMCDANEHCLAGKPKASRP